MSISHDRSFLFLGAACAALLAVTTFLLWFMPHFVAPADNLAAQIERLNNPWYTGRLWVNFIHMWLGLVSLMAAAALLARRRPGFAWLGFACFGIWVIVELLGVSVNLLSVNLTWRAGHAAADAQTQAMLAVLISGWPGVWEALYFTLVIAFLCGSLLYSFAALTDPAGGWARVVGAAFMVGALLSVAFLVSGYGGPQWPGDIAGAAYPVVQPVARMLIAIWIFKSAKALPRA